ncbi:MAG: hypothetical protein KF788_08695 [Piscinibacter sp.]|nr:hypothetical protein [Piscinibacter sp.]
MSRPRRTPPSPSAPIWWASHGLVCYIGAGNEGLEFQRHSCLCDPGFWRVSVTGWGAVGRAVVDDFGTLVKVYR